MAHSRAEPLTRFAALMLVLLLRAGAADQERALRGARRDGAVGFNHSGTPVLAEDVKAAADSPFTLWIKLISDKKVVGQASNALYQGTDWDVFKLNGDSALGAAISQYCYTYFGAGDFNAGSPECIAADEIQVFVSAHENDWANNGWQTYFKTTKAPEDIWFAVMAATADACYGDQPIQRGQYCIGAPLTTDSNLYRCGRVSCKDGGQCSALSQISYTPPAGLHIQSARPWMASAGSQGLPDLGWKWYDAGSDNGILTQKINFWPVADRPKPDGEGWVPRPYHQSGCFAGSQANDYFKDQGFYPYQVVQADGQSPFYGGGAGLCATGGDSIYGLVPRGGPSGASASIGLRTLCGQQGGRWVSETDYEASPAGAVCPDDGRYSLAFKDADADGNLRWVYPSVSYGGLSGQNDLFQYPLGEFDAPSWWRGVPAGALVLGPYFLDCGSGYMAWRDGSSVPDIPADGWGACNPGANYADASDDRYKSAEMPDAGTCVEYRFYRAPTEDYRDSQLPGCQKDNFLVGQSFDEDEFLVGMIACGQNQNGELVGVTGKATKDGFVASEVGDCHWGKTFFFDFNYILGCTIWHLVDGRDSSCKRIMES